MLPDRVPQICRINMLHMWCLRLFVMSRNCPQMPKIQSVQDHTTRNNPRWQVKSAPSCSYECVFRAKKPETFQRKTNDKTTAKPLQWWIPQHPTTLRIVLPSEKKRVLCMSWIAGKELFCKDEVRFRIVGGQYAWNYDLQLEDVGSSADCPRIQFCLALATHGNTHQFLLDLLEFVTTIQPKCKPKDIQGCWDLHGWAL